MVTAFLFSILAFSGQIIPLEAIPDRPLNDRGPGFYGESLFALRTWEHFYVWDKTGQLIHTLPVPEGHTFNAWIEIPEGLLISYHNREKKLGTWLFNDSFEIIADFDFFSARYHRVGDTIYTFPISTETGQLELGHVYLFSPIKIQGTHGELELVRSDPRIAKAPDIMRKFGFNYKQAWLVADAEGYLVANELENKIYRYSPADISFEKRTGLGIPSKKSGQVLTLNNFNPLLDDFDPPKGAYKNGEVRKMLWQYQEAHSRILGFDRFRKGFIIGYQVPNCDENGDCQESLLGLQRFDENLNPIGGARVQPGMYGGVKDDAVYVLQFERQLGLPLPEGPYRPSLLILSDW